MKLFKFKFVHPIGKKQFQLHVLKSIVIQLLFFSILMLIFYFCELINPNFNKLILGAILVILYCIAFVSIFDFNKLRARYKDIYPNHEINPSYFILSFFCPVWFYGLVIYLCFKREDSVAKPNFLFTIRYALSLSVCILVIQFAFPSFAYWSGLPSNYYIANICGDIKNIIALKDEATFDRNAFDRYTQHYSKNLSPTENVLLVAVDATVITKEKQRRAIANELDRKESNIQISLAMLEIMKKSLLQAEKFQYQISEFSFMHWIYPSGPVEIILLSLVDQKINSKLCKVIYDRSVPVITAVDEGVQKFKGPRKEIYSAKLAKLRQEFQNTRTYKGQRSVAFTK